MAADLILTSGPFFGHIGDIELKRLAAEARKRGCPWVRAHQHKQWIVMEGWCYKPDEQGDLPSPAYLDALCNKEIKSGDTLTKAWAPNK